MWDNNKKIRYLKRLIVKNGESNMSSFGEKLKKLRIEKGWTQEQLAHHLHTSKQVISRYENGQRTPKITVAQEYANVLGVPLSYLLDAPDLESVSIKPNNSKIDRYHISTDFFDTKNSSVDTQAGSTEDEIKLYRALVDSGIIPEGGDLTSQQIDFLDGISTIISAFFDKDE